MKPRLAWGQYILGPVNAPAWPGTTARTESGAPRLGPRSVGGDEILPEGMVEQDLLEEFMLLLQLGGLCRMSGQTQRKGGALARLLRASMRPP